MTAAEQRAVCEPVEVNDDPTGALLLGYQCRWLEDEAGVKVIEKSRRIGITWATAAYVSLHAAEGIEDIWYLSYTEDSGKEFIRDCEQWCRNLNIAASEMREVLLREDEDGDLEGVRAFCIEFPSGKRITAVSTARALRGKQGIVIIDEAAFHDDLPAVLKAAFALRMWGGSVWIMSTHNGADNPFNTLVEEVRDGKRPYSLHRVTLDDALADGLYKRICLVSGQQWSPEAEREWVEQLKREYGDGADEELYCVPSKSGASYLGRDLIQRAMFDAPVLRFEQEESWAALPAEERTRVVREWLTAVVDPILEALPDVPHAFGWDFGRFSDLSVLAPLTITRDMKKRAPFLLEMRRIPFNDQWLVLEHVARRLPRLTFASLDAGGNGAWIAEQAWMHLGQDQVVERVQLSQSWYRDNMPAFKSAHESGLIFYPRDLDVLADLLLVRRINGVPMLPKEKNEGASGRRHGDAAIALALAESASRRAEEILTRWQALSTM